MKPIKKIGILAPSSVTPQVELYLTMNWMKEQGFECVIHPNVFKQDWAYAGTDQERARAILDFAFDKSIDAIWCTRGGFGATHLLPILAKATARKKPAKKMLLGFSDVTALHSFVTKFWKWETAHAPMPALRSFTVLKPDEHEKLLKTFSRDPSPDSVQLELLAGKKPKGPMKMPIFGGNLAVWASLTGTPYLLKTNKPHFLFFEDIQEAPARILRMLHQLAASGAFKFTKGFILGDFTDCKDGAPLVFKKNASINANVLKNTPNDLLEPLRPTLDANESMQEVATRLHELTGALVARGFPAGHGTQHMTLNLGKPVTLKPDGTFLF